MEDDGFSQSFNSSRRNQGAEARNSIGQSSTGMDINVTAGDEPGYSGLMDASASGLTSVELAIRTNNRTVYNSDGMGGFSLLRLMSSGPLVSQSTDQSRIKFSSDASHNQVPYIHSPQHDIFGGNASLGSQSINHGEGKTGYRIYRNRTVYNSGEVLNFAPGELSNTQPRAVSEVEHGVSLNPDCSNSFGQLADGISLSLGLGGNNTAGMLTEDQSRRLPDIGADMMKPLGSSPGPSYEGHTIAATNIPDGRMSGALTRMNISDPVGGGLTLRLGAHISPVIQVDDEGWSGNQNGPCVPSDPNCIQPMQIDGGLTNLREPYPNINTVSGTYNALPSHGPYNHLQYTSPLSSYAHQATIHPYQLQYGYPLTALCPSSGFSTPLSSARTPGSYGQPNLVRPPVSIPAGLRSNYPQMLQGYPHVISSSRAVPPQGISHNVGCTYPRAHSSQLFRPLSTSVMPPDSSARCEVDPVKFEKFKVSGSLADQSMSGCIPIHYSPFSQVSKIAGGVTQQNPLGNQSAKFNVQAKSVNLSPPPRIAKPQPKPRAPRKPRTTTKDIPTQPKPTKEIYFSPAVPSSFVKPSQEHIRHTEPDDIKLVGSKCGLCNNDLLFVPGGSTSNHSNDPPVVAVLPCAHTYHAYCLEEITPDEMSSDPPCVSCGIAESISQPPPP